MKRTLSILAFFILFSFSSFAQNDKAYENTLSEMFQVSGSEETFKVAINQILAAYKGQYPQVSAEIWTEMEAEFQKASMDELVVMLAPAYQKHLTQKDLQELIKFYKTPIGTKFAKKTPLLTREAMQVGQQWGMKIGQDFAAKMKAKGY
ncbi:hypothetical protein EV201_3327 [Ancylomarina subtilis]|uniref:DUF2059 domain-containing protein n=1 Tax=Ancylomarina subtilis TaxID=1639035 RepID=A0A4Q7V5M4_9BACT|nr:DUF2059 domain-containing protein [Ancylomarina subtilis]RZT91114.1 hypothetical protein EV201_3327 [Ancylomarina subtilis]